MNAFVREISEFLNKGELRSRYYHDYIERTISSLPDCLHLPFNPLSSVDSCHVSDTLPTARAEPRTSLHSQSECPQSRAYLALLHVSLSSLRIRWRLNNVLNISFTKKDSGLTWTWKRNIHSKGNHFLFQDVDNLYRAELLH